MTDYRDFQYSGLRTDQASRTAGDYRRRDSGGSGLLVALTIVALLLVSFIVFASRAPDSTTPVPTPGVTGQQIPEEPAAPPAVGPTE